MNGIPPYTMLANVQKKNDKTYLLRNEL